MAACTTSDDHGDEPVARALARRVAELEALLKDAVRRRDDRIAVLERRAALLEERERAAWRMAVALPLRGGRRAG